MKCDVKKYLKYLKDRKIKNREKNSLSRLNKLKLAEKNNNYYKNTNVNHLYKHKCNYIKDNGTGNIYIYNYISYYYDSNYCILTIRMLHHMGRNCKKISN
jgi:hypothetical protein